jgi:hypothetical protein
MDGLLEGGCEAGRNSGAGDAAAGSSVGCCVLPTAAGRGTERSCPMDRSARPSVRSLVAPAEEVAPGLFEDGAVVARVSARWGCEEKGGRGTLR